MDFAFEDAMLAVDTCVLNSPSLGDELRGPTLVPTTSRVVPMMCCPDDTVKKVRPPANKSDKTKGGAHCQEGAEAMPLHCVSETSAFEAEHTRSTKAPDNTCLPKADPRGG